MRLVSETPHVTRYGCPYQSLGFELDDGRVLRVSGTLEAGVTWVARFRWDAGEDGHTPICFAYVPAFDNMTRFYADLLNAQDSWSALVNTFDPTVSVEQLVVDTTRHM